MCLPSLTLKSSISILDAARRIESIVEGRNKNHSTRTRNTIPCYSGNDFTQANKKKSILHFSIDVFQCYICTHAVVLFVNTTFILNFKWVKMFLMHFLPTKK